MTFRYNEYTPAGHDIEKMEYDARKASTGRDDMGWAHHDLRDGLDDVRASVGYDRHSQHYAYEVDGAPTPRTQVATMLINLRRTAA